MDRIYAAPTLVTSAVHKTSGEIDDGDLRDALVAAAPEFDKYSLKQIPSRHHHSQAKKRQLNKASFRSKLVMRKPASLDKAICKDDAPIEIIPGLYIGSIHCAFNDQALKNAGITHIVNATGLPATFPRLFTYLTLGMRDKEYTNLFSSIPISNTFIHAVLEAYQPQDQQNQETDLSSRRGAVLVHCSFGRSRSAALVVAYLMKSQGMKYEEALLLVKSRRPVVSMNPGFQEQLQYFEDARGNAHQAHQLYVQARASLGLPRTRAHRPSSSTLHLHSSSEPICLPRMLTMDLEFACRNCKVPLFHSADVLLPSTTHTTACCRDVGDEDDDNQEFEEEGEEEDGEQMPSQDDSEEEEEEEAFSPHLDDDIPRPASRMLPLRASPASHFHVMLERTERLSALTFDADSSHYRKLESLVRLDDCIVRDMLAQEQLVLGQPLQWMPCEKVNEMSKSPIICPGCSSSLGFRPASCMGSYGCEINSSSVIARESK